MASQKTIKNFFKPDNKRKNPVNNSTKEQMQEQDKSIKKMKTLEGDGEGIQPLRDHPGFPNQGNVITLSPDQRGRMQENKLKAEIKLQSKRTPALHSTMGPSWFQALKTQFTQPYFVELSKFLVSARQRATIYPPEDQVYSWTQYCTLSEVKVVILGQDPYHGQGQAHGLCFSVPVGTNPPPSLLNMYNELESDIPGFVRPSHGFLAGWAEQGVLLLNACLTVQAHQANSHKDRGWEKFTDAVIKAVSQHNRGVVFLLWGSYAQKKAAVVDKKRHHLLHAPHPSPLSAHRGFFGCKHFSKCNKLLQEAGKKPIDWCNFQTKE